MIYLDNSATTYPKPDTVINAVNRAMRRYSFNPGRGGYRQSIDTAQEVYNVRKQVRDFFHVSEPENVIFTPGCTQALNLVFKGVLHHGDHVILSSFEHNAVLRPLEKMKNDGIITCSVASVIAGDDDAIVENFRQAINSNTRLIVCTHASNVFGIRLPVERLCALAHSYGIMFCLDAAQSAGVLPIDMQSDGYDFVCCPGHKYLYGPMGIGLLLLGDDISVATVIEGGTGSESADAAMPSYYPDRLEAGTQNIPGIIGLEAGIDFVNRNGIEDTYRRESYFIQKLYRRMQKLPGITVHSPDPQAIPCVPVLSFSVRDKDSEEVARYLSDKSNIAVRSGLHCAPLAHKSMGTLSGGVVRVSPGAFTSGQDIQILLNSLMKIG